MYSVIIKQIIFLFIFNLNLMILDKNGLLMMAIKNLAQLTRQCLSDKNL